jgi:hypothetical protein
MTQEWIVDFNRPMRLLLGCLGLASQIGLHLQSTWLWHQATHMPTCSVGCRY